MLTRAYNVRLGICRKDDMVPERFFKEPTKPPINPPLDLTMFNRTIDSYYELRGYNKNGIPNGQTLEELDLGYVREDLVERGILSNEKNKKNRD